MKRKLILFTDRYPYGKSEAFLESEIEYLCKSFEKVTILPFEKGTDKNIRAIPKNAELLNPPLIKAKRSPELLFKGIFNTYNIAPFLSEGLNARVWKSFTKFRIWFTHLLVIRTLMSEIKRQNLLNFFNKNDILYFYWGLRWSQIIPFLPEEVISKKAVRFHGSDLYEHTNNNYIPWRKKQLERTDLIVTVSETGKNYMMEKYNIPPEKIFLSRIGTKDYGINPYKKRESIRIVSCSNIVPVKRVELLAMALKHLTIKAEWVHFGDGKYRKKVERLASQLPANISYEFPGVVSHDELIGYYKNTTIDVFINVSSSEGVPVSVMEALSFGIPVIATPAGGTPEIVSEKNGIIIPLNFEPAYLAKKIEELVGNDNYLEYRSAARQTWEEKCREDKLFPEFVEYLSSLC
ncbi:MAG TPA: glycosyltransferase [Bacteroidales bacterium]|nr:glycosyltransferase [Bacteroidales bacterium]HOU95680.1 glycosyltransferase [Bacteroidales bacterium]HQG36293.1 glycosyltransferase [Bacteroidales bacterium]HQG52216.1 glycosyltransferase [Bacteroidales bacterium]HQJ19852.1 glycosyltransferase [Bacteroidales bacterium]